MNEILSLAPQNVWKHFYSLTQIPRPSGHLEKIQAFFLLILLGVYGLVALPLVNKKRTGK